MRLIIGGEESKQRFLVYNDQETINFYPLTDPNTTSALNNLPQARPTVAMATCPGSVFLGQHPAGQCRAVILCETTNLLYAVFGVSFVSLLVTEGTLTFGYTTLGTIGRSTGDVFLADNGAQIGIIDEAFGYTWNYLTNTFTTVSDPDFIAANSITNAKGFFIYGVANTQNIFQSAYRDGTAFNALDAAKKENEGDPVVRVFTNGDILWVFGTKTIEPWAYNSASLQFAFLPQPGSTIRWGLLAANSVCRFRDTLAFLDSRNYVSVLNGYQVEILSTAPINAVLADMPTTTDAIFSTYTDSGHEYLICQFPTGGKTLVFDDYTSAWHVRSSFVTGAEARYLANYAINYLNKVFLFSYIDGSVYRLEPTLSTEAGGSSTHTRVMPRFTIDNKWVGISKFEIYVNTGDAGISEVDPVVLLYISKNGGRTYLPAKRAVLGAMGEYGRRVFWTRLGTARSWTFKIVVTAKSPIIIIDGFVDMDPVDGTDATTGVVGNN